MCPALFCFSCPDDLCTVASNANAFYSMSLLALCFPSFIPPPPLRIRLWLAEEEEELGIVYFRLPSHCNRFPLPPSFYVVVSGYESATFAADEKGESRMVLLL
jgi:hypothetical protein